MFRRTFFALLGLVLISGVGVLGQTKSKSKAKEKKPPSANEVRTLDSEAEKAKEEFVRSLAGVAEGYENAGLTDKATETLKEILQIVPDSETTRQRLEELEQRAFDENQILVEVEAGKGWATSHAMITRGKPITIEVEGDYRLTMNETIGPDGLPTGDPKTELAAGMPFGALIAVIVPPNSGGPPRPMGNQKPNDQQLRPFLIGKGMENFEPKEDGLLLFKLNVPSTGKSAGKIRLMIRGNLRDLNAGK